MRGSLSAASDILISSLALRCQPHLISIIERGLSEVRVNVPRLSDSGYEAIVQRSAHFLHMALDNTEFVAGKGTSTAFHSVISLTCPQIINDHIAEYVERSKALGFVHRVVFIIDDWLEEKHNVFGVAISALQQMVGCSPVFFGSRICYVDWSGMSISIMRCSDWNESPNLEDDMYIIPPGTQLKQFLRGTAY